VENDNTADDGAAAVMMTFAGVPQVGKAKKVMARLFDKLAQSARK